MGGSSSSQLDETTSNQIRVQTEAELKGFSPHFRKQYCVALCSKLQEELEQQNTSPALLLRQREPSDACGVLYEGGVLQCEDGKKWKDRWVVLRDYSLEIHDNQEMWKKGAPPRQKLVVVGGAVVTSKEKYEALVHKAAPDLSNGQEESAPELVPPTAFPVFLRLPYRRDVYLCCQDDEQRRNFLSILGHSIRHQNHDCLHKPTCEMQAFLAAIHYHRQDKGHYESWDMLVGDDTQVLTHLVMEVLIPFLQKELLPQLKGKRAERRRAWLSLVEAAHSQVLAQVQEGMQHLKEECSTAAQQQGVLLRSNMDQISSSRTFLETKLQAMMSQQAQSVCAEHVTPYLSSVLEELLGPVNGGFQAVRQLCDEQLERLCRDVRQGWTLQQVQQALQQASKAELEESFQRLEVLHEKLQELQDRFRFSNTTKLVQGAQRHMQQLMDNAMYTFESLLQSAVKDNPAQLGSVMEKAKQRVLKQYDYDSSTVRKRFFQEALVDITLPVLRRHLGPTCRPELEKFEQYIFADCTDFINVENVYEDILRKTLTPEVNKVVKEAASQKKHNMFVDSSDLQSISQGSLSDSRTPPRSAPSSPSKQADPARSQQPELRPSPLANSTGGSDGSKEGTEGQQGQYEKQVQEGKEEEEQAKEQEVPLKEQAKEPDSTTQLASAPAKPKEEASPPKPQTSPEPKEEESPKPQTSPEPKEEESPKPQTSPEPKEEASPPKPHTSPEPKEEASPKPQTSSEPKEEASPPKPQTSPEPKEEASPKPQTSPEPKEEASPTKPQTSPEDLLSLGESEPVAPDASRARTDRAIYLSPPAGAPAGSAVPLSEDDSTSGDLTASQASTAPPGGSDETAPAGDEGSGEETGGGGRGPGETGGQGAEGESTSLGLVASAQTAGSTTAPPSGMGEEEEEEEEGPLDSVKAIRDLVVEVIEVEDFIQPCPGGSAP